MGWRESDIRAAEEQARVLEARRDEVVADFKEAQRRAEEELLLIEGRLTVLSAVRSFLVEREAASVPPTPVGPPEYVNGIDVSRLDHETRILVVAGNPETLMVLRRNLALVEPAVR